MIEYAKARQSELHVKIGTMSKLPTIFILYCFDLFKSLLAGGNNFNTGPVYLKQFARSYTLIYNAEKNDFIPNI